MTRRISAAKLKKRKNNRLGIIMIVLSLLVVVFAAVMAVRNQPIHRDQHGCVENGNALVAHTIILVDQTNSLDKRELEFVRAVIFNEFSQLPMDGRMTIRTIDETVDEESDQLTICRIKAEANVAIENEREVKANFEKTVGKPLTEFLDRLPKQKEKDWSPIFESIADVYRRIDFNKQIDNRRLVIFSDMAQHSPQFDQYPCRISAPPPKTIDNDFVAEVPRSTVVIQYINRRLCMQGEAHKEFWKSTLAAMGADVSIGHSLTLGWKPSQKIKYEGK